MKSFQGQIGGLSVNWGGGLPPKQKKVRKEGEGYLWRTKSDKQYLTASLSSRRGKMTKVDGKLRRTKSNLRSKYLFLKYVLSFTESLSNISLAILFKLESEEKGK